MPPLGCRERLFHSRLSRTLQVGGFPRWSGNSHWIAVQRKPLWSVKVMKESIRRPKKLDHWIKQFEFSLVQPSRSMSHYIMAVFRLVGSVAISVIPRGAFLSVSTKRRWGSMNKPLSQWLIIFWLDQKLNHCWTWTRTHNQTGTRI